MACIQHVVPAHAGGRTKPKPASASFSEPAESGPVEAEPSAESIGYRTTIKTGTLSCAGDSQTPGTRWAESILSTHAAQHAVHTQRSPPWQHSTRVRSAGASRDGPSHQDRHEWPCQAEQPAVVLHGRARRQRAEVAAMWAGLLGPPSRHTRRVVWRCPTERDWNAATS